MKIRVLFNWVLICLLTIENRNLATAQSVPPLINYQGQLQDASGAPLATADYVLTFAVWDSATLGSRVWGPQIFDGRPGDGHGPKIPVVRGYFNVMLGPIDTNRNSIAGAYGATNRYVEIGVDNASPISPRQQILSAPFALWAENSQKLQGKDWNDLVVDPELLPNGIPAAKLHRSVLDALTPSGAIVAYGGVNPPEGWFLCDGQQVSRITRARLFAVIGTAWGQGNGSTTFHLPDLRGMFLRGVNGTRIDVYADSDVNSRTNLLSTGYTGNYGNAVGSVQGDQLKDHIHRFKVSGLAGSGGYNTVGFAPDPNDNIQEAGILPSGGGTETRPKNAYVNYIIKY